METSVSNSYLICGTPMHPVNSSCFDLGFMICIEFYQHLSTNVSNQNVFWNICWHLVWQDWFIYIYISLSYHHPSGLPDKVRWNLAMICHRRQASINHSVADIQRWHQVWFEEKHWINMLFWSNSDGQRLMLTKITLTSSPTRKLLIDMIILMIFFKKMLEICGVLVDFCWFLGKSQNTCFLRRKGVPDTYRKSNP